MLRCLTALLALASPLHAFAQDLVLEDAVADDAPPYFELPFTVPEGTVEIEVRHDDLSDANILDWGLRDPERFRGWGGGNTEPAIVGVEAASRSYLHGPIPAGEWAVIVGKALVAEPPARYRIEISLRTEATLPPQTERAPYSPSAALAPGPAWFAGDFHVHSRESGDAYPTLDEVATFAASRGMDFIELSEHNTVSQLDYITDAQARHPTVLFIPGIEVTTYFGHANAIGATEWIDFQVMSGTDVTIETILADTAAQGAVFSINHPVLDLGDSCLGCAWALDAPPTGIRAVEIQNGAYSVTGTLFYAPSLRFWEQLLDTGAHVAAIGGSDDHRAGTDLGMFQSPIGSPTTMVYADELSAAAIARAVAEGRTVVKLEGPEAPMVELFAGDAMIGDTVTDRAVELRARVAGGTGTMLRFVKNGRTEETVPVDADPFEATLSVAAPPGDVDDRWRLELVSGQPRVLTSHIFIQATGEPVPMDAGTTPPPTEDDGCGCRIAPPRDRGALTLVAITLVALLYRRRSR